MVQSAILTKRSRQKKATSERLIASAYRRFCRDGIAATRVTDVAAAASVSHGTAFVHFSTRDELVAAVIKRYGGRIALRLHELAASRAGLRDVLRAHLDGLNEHEKFYARLVVETPSLGKTARTMLIGIQSAISTHMAAAADRDRAEGLIRAVPSSFLFNLWIGLVHHYITNRDLFAPGSSVLERRGREMIDQFMTLLTTH